MTQKKVEPVYYKEHIPLIRRDNLCTLGNCLVAEIQSLSEKYFLTCSYCSRSQSQEEFEIFCTNFDIFLSQKNDEFSLCSIATGDLNLMLVVQVDGKTTFLIQQVEK